ncbi:BLUF domain-containing protein [Hasllibacter sp. MH4015]|uniref:BLUF domain-containing protein n=1 Tax=Hasllibacter sp. MH4015 TaxID=2854029 RepID=UPI001CD2B8D9|nr:BLUF domain-containing protein [Hasllibacter sp. MH4015]
MDLTQIIYASRPFGFDASVLSNLLVDARRCNARDGITGALVCRRDIYLQYLEGSDRAVRNTLERIRRDDRHVELVVHHDAPSHTRLFSDWAMLHDPAHSWTWSEAEVADGALDRALPADFLNVFLGIAQRQ